MSSDEALHTLFQRKMDNVSSDDPASVQMMSDFYLHNEMKLINLCRKHKEDKKYKRLRDFVTFEYNMLHNPPTLEEPPTN
jgi:hypothetical protein